MEELQVSPNVKGRIELTLKDYSSAPELEDNLLWSFSSYPPESELEDNLLWSFSSHHIPSYRISIDRNDMPVPGLIEYMLVNVLGFQNFGPDEKLRWLVSFSYQGMRCSLAYQKFGVRLYIAKDDVAEQDVPRKAKEIIGKLNRAAKIIERQVLDPYATTQIRNGNVTVVNQYHNLDRIYQYFREQAFRTFSDNPELGLFEGFCNALAMINAYFSRLEHLLVIVLPFINFSPAADDLVKIIGSQWGDKYRQIFDINQDKPAKLYYDQLHDIKERFRNTFSHGGFEKDGASLYFHLPAIGAIPARLTEIRNSPHFNFLPLAQADFNEVCSLFDEFDNWLESGKTQYGVLYAKSGLNVAFDAESLQKYELAMTSPEDFDNMLEYYSYLSDIHTNMEY
jgi:hypothetical protein